MCGAWHRILLALAVQVAVTAGQQCGKAGSLTKIVGGQSVESLKYPWYVALVSPTRSSTLQVSCGGSLITSRHVLSAAHCFPKTPGVRPEQLYYAVLGLVNRCSQKDVDQANIIRVRIHPDYNTKTLRADISVITLERAVSYTPVCLPPKNYQPYGPALIIGFGSTLVKSQYPCTLQQAEVDILSKRQCAQSSLTPENSHVPGTICAGVKTGGVDSCDGDSGGPIMTVGQDGGYIIQGIVSFGEGCARKNLPGIYTKVSTYCEFIDSAISSTEDLNGEGDDISSTLFPLDDKNSSSPTISEDPTPSTPLVPSFSSLLDSLLALLFPRVDDDSATGSSSVGGGGAPGGAPGGVVGNSAGTSRPLSPLEYYWLQFFNRTPHRRVPPSSAWALG